MSVVERIEDFKNNLRETLKKCMYKAYLEKTKVELEIEEYDLGSEDTEKIEEEAKRYADDLFEKQAKVFSETFEKEFMERVHNFISETLIIEGDGLNFSSFKYNNINFKKLDLSFDEDTFEVDNENKLQLRDGAITFEKISGNTITEGIVDGSITGPKINIEVPGIGLSFDDSRLSINVNVDNDTIKLSNNNLYVADNSIDENKFSESVNEYFEQKIEEYLDNNILNILNKYIENSSFKK